MRFTCRVTGKSPKPPSYFVIRTFPILTKHEKEARFMIAITWPKEFSVSLYHFLLCYVWWLIFRTYARFRQIMAVFLWFFYFSFLTLFHFPLFIFCLSFFSLFFVRLFSVTKRGLLISSSQKFINVQFCLNLFRSIEALLFRVLFSATKIT